MSNFNFKPLIFALPISVLAFPVVVANASSTAQTGLVLALNTEDPAALEREALDAEAKVELANQALQKSSAELEAAKTEKENSTKEFNHYNSQRWTPTFLQMGIFTEYPSNAKNYNWKELDSRIAASKEKSDKATANFDQIDSKTKQLTSELSNAKQVAKAAREKANAAKLTAAMPAATTVQSAATASPISSQLKQAMAKFKADQSKCMQSDSKADALANKLPALKAAEKTKASKQLTTLKLNKKQLCSSAVQSRNAYNQLIPSAIAERVSSCRSIVKAAKNKTAKAIKEADTATKTARNSCIQAAKTKFKRLSWQPPA